MVKEQGLCAKPSENNLPNTHWSTHTDPPVMGKVVRELP